MDLVICEQASGVATVTLNRPQKRNALNGELLVSLLEALDQCEQDPEVRLVCITGAGDKAFCSGADLSEFEEKNLASEHKLFSRVLDRLYHYTKPTVAAVNGVCMGGGFGMMLCCDLVYAVNDAQIGTPEIHVGLYPMMISYLLYENLPRKIAEELMLCGRVLSATEAKEFHLINDCLPRDSFQDEVQKKLCKLGSKPAKVLSLGKTQCQKAKIMDFKEAQLCLSRSFFELVQLPEAKKAIGAFLQKRPQPLQKQSMQLQDPSHPS